MNKEVQALTLSFKWFTAWKNRRISICLQTVKD